MTLLEVSSIHKKDIMREIENAISNNSQNKALVISGDAVLKALYGDSVKRFIKLTDVCQVILACRVSPQQKAQLVELIRDYKPEVRTLSIGDGANDVNMITAAHVGIGISGLEGQQAARASDYSISQFCYLRRLLFVHGRECYRRNAILICYNFYKNVLLVLPLLFFGTEAAFSGQLIYNTWTYQLFNVTYAALPIVLYAIFDREMDLDHLNYSHYDIGAKDKLFSTTIFWKWVLEGTLQAYIICFICLYGICYTTGHSETGRIDSLWVASCLMYGMVVILVNVKILLFSYAYYWFNVSLIIASIFFYFFSTKILDTSLPIADWLDNFDMRGSVDQMAKNPNTYIVIFLITYMSFFVQSLYGTLKSLVMMRSVKNSFVSSRSYSGPRVNS
jgi:phospholipid-transporting ATPase